MSSKTAYIISLKFAPGLKKEFMVLGENIRKIGINVKYLLSEEYKHLEGNCPGMEYISTSNNLKNILLDTIRFIFTPKEFLQSLFANPPIFLCFYNPHPINPFISRFVKKIFPKVKCALYLHDPYKPDKRPYGMTKSAYITIVEFIQGFTLEYMDYVISPSEYSFQLFKKRYPKFSGETHIAPILVPDRGVLNGKNRRFFSMVGSAHEATGHDTFVELINYVAEKELDYEFVLISSSNISKYLKNLRRKGRKIVKVINAKIITDSEIDEVIRESYAVFRLDREITQSGVIPVSYMNATPVIVRNIPGLTQHVKHGENGYILPFNCTLEDIIQAMNFLKKNYPRLSKIARENYEEIWADWNWDRYYDWLIAALHRN